MSFERGNRLKDGLVLLEPYLTMNELVNIRDRCAGRAVRETGDGAYRVISEVLSIMIDERIEECR
jgi:hypothetical protein